MSESLDQIAMALERCEGMFTSTFIDFENISVEAIEDLYTLAEFLRDIAPRRKRPTPMEGEARVGDKAFGIVFMAVRPLSFENVCNGRSPRWMEVEGDGKLMNFSGPRYATREDACLALHWKRFEALAASA